MLEKTLETILHVNGGVDDQMIGLSNVCHSMEFDGSSGDSDRSIQL